MYWHESIPHTKDAAVRHPESIQRSFSSQQVNHLIRRLDDLENGYDAMSVALCYAASLIGRPANELYEESKASNVQTYSCKRW